MIDLLEVLAFLVVELGLDTVIVVQLVLTVGFGFEVVVADVVQLCDVHGVGTTVVVSLQELISSAQTVMVLVAEVQIVLVEGPLGHLLPVHSVRVAVGMRRASVPKSSPSVSKSSTSQSKSSTSVSQSSSGNGRVRQSAANQQSLESRG